MKTTVQELALTIDPTRSSTAKTRTTALAVLSTLLAACSIVPGQHMETPPTLAVSSAPDGTVQQSQQIAIQAIDLNLINQMRAGAVHLQQANLLDLFSKPAPY